MADYSNSRVVPGTQNAYDPSGTNKHLNTHRASGMPNISADTGSMPVTTTNISVWCNGSRVGVIKSFGVTEQRQNTKLKELGTEGVVQIVPGNTRGGDLKVDRFALYNSTLFNALGLTRTGEFVNVNDYDNSPGNQADAKYHRPTNSTFSNPFKTLKDQRVPLEIQTKTQLHGNEDAWYVETYVDCWLSSYSKTISSDQITITENANISYSDVFAEYVSSNNSN